MTVVASSHRDNCTFGVAVSSPSSQTTALTATNEKIIYSSSKQQLQQQEQQQRLFGTTTTTTVSTQTGGDLYPLAICVSGVPKAVYEDQIKTVALQFCPELKNQQRQDLIVKPLLGGLSNELFLVEQQQQQSDDKEIFRVLVRIHPISNNNKKESSSYPPIVDRDVENRLVLWLSSLQHQAPTTKKDVATETTTTTSFLRVPKIYGRFHNGRLEEFYNHHEPLSCHDMKHYEPQMATLLARLHALTVPSHVMQPYSTTTTTTTTGDIWHRVNQWLQTATTIAEKKSSSDKEDDDSETVPSSCSSSSDDDDDRKEKQQQQQNNREAKVLSLATTEWAWLKSKLMTTTTTTKEEQSSNTTTTTTTTDKEVQEERALELLRYARAFGSEIVLTHMDMQSLNLLRPTASATAANNNSDERDEQSSSSLKVIDFEYAGFNPRAMDIANTFCEHCDMNNLRARYDAEYPSLESQNEFLTAYLDCTTAAAATTTSCGWWSDVKNNTDERDVVLCELQFMIGQYTLVSHLEWVIWSIVQHHTATNTAGYDYLAYAQHRLEGYQFHKQQFFEKAEL